MQSSRPDGAAGGAAATPYDPEAQIDALAPLLGLNVEEAWRPRVVRFMALARSMAEIVEHAPLPEGGLDLAPVFRPGRRGGDPA